MQIRINGVFSVTITEHRIMFITPGQSPAPPRMRGASVREAASDCGGVCAVESVTVPQNASECPDMPHQIRNCEIEPTAPSRWVQWFTKQTHSNPTKTALARW